MSTTEEKKSAGRPAGASELLSFEGMDARDKKRMLKRLMPYIPKAIKIHTDIIDGGYDANVAQKMRASDVVLELAFRLQKDIESSKPQGNEKPEDSINNKPKVVPFSTDIKAVK